MGRLFLESPGEKSQIASYPPLSPLMGSWKKRSDEAIRREQLDYRIT